MNYYLMDESRDWDTVSAAFMSREWRSILGAPVQLGLTAKANIRTTRSLPDYIRVNAAPVFSQRAAAYIEGLDKAHAQFLPVEIQTLRGTTLMHALNPLRREAALDPVRSADALARYPWPSMKSVILDPARTLGRPFFAVANIEYFDHIVYDESFLAGWRERGFKGADFSLLPDEQY